MKFLCEKPTNRVLTVTRTRRVGRIDPDRGVVWLREDTLEFSINLPSIVGRVIKKIKNTVQSLGEKLGMLLVPIPGYAAV
jgi:hypothetical protein